ncbi:MAG: DMT family transporter [Gammaproteobacteria bacterium]|nr:MAG: DMT family transporter [Gammaproteobacteria bacterium]
MPIIACYILVVVIWSTTPLAITLSSGSVSFVAAVTLRMVAAAFFAYATCKLFKIAIPFDKKSIAAYISGAIGAFGGLLCVYWGSAYVPSGLISIMFGLTPIISAILAALILKEQFLTTKKVFSIIISIAGLSLVFGKNVNESAGLTGIAIILFAVLLFNVSTICVKLTGTELHPLGQTTGTLFVSSAFYIVAWACIDGTIPNHISIINMLSIIYLAIGGSVIGFIAYYFVLQKMNVVSVGLITLMTPVFAMLLGVFANNEKVINQQWIGLAIVIIGLALFVLTKQESAKKIAE